MYVKLIDGKIEEAPVNKDGICNYNLDVERMIADGYKLFVPVTPPSEEEIRMYHYEYIENIDNIQETIIYDETQEEAEERIKRINKENKTNEINQKISELESLIIKELRLGNEENIQIYNEVIKGLEETKDNL